MTGRPTLSQQEALANIMRIGRPLGSSQTWAALKRNRWATYDVRTGSFHLTDEGLQVLREAAAR